MTILGGTTITADGDSSHEITRRLLLGRKSMTNLDSILKSREKKKIKQRHHFADKDLYNQSYSFSSSHAGIQEFNHKESQAPN